MEMTDLLRFEVHDNFIETPKGQLYFFRHQPPNQSIMSDGEKEFLYQAFENLMRQTDQVEFALYAADSPVSLQANREFVQSLSEPISGMNEALLEELSAAQHQAYTDRAYYIIVRDKKVGSTAVKDIVAAIMAQNNLPVTLAERNELITILRGWLLREFVDDQIYLGDEVEEDG